MSGRVVKVSVRSRWLQENCKLCDTHAALFVVTLCIWFIRLCLPNLWSLYPSVYKACYFFVLLFTLNNICFTNMGGSFLLFCLPDSCSTTQNKFVLNYQSSVRQTPDMNLYCLYDPKCLIWVSIILIYIVSRQLGYNFGICCSGDLMLYRWSILSRVFTFLHFLQKLHNILYAWCYSSSFGNRWKLFHCTC